MMEAVLERYPKLRILSQWAAEHSISLTVLPGPEHCGEPDAKTLRILAQHGEMRLTVFDEYGDARSENTLLCLLLIQNEIAELELGSYKAWARAHGLDETPVSRQIYEMNRATAEQIMRDLGPIPEVTSALDWQLNAGAVQALRQLGR